MEIDYFMDCYGRMRWRVLVHGEATTLRYECYSRVEALRFMARQVKV
jgi:hypothetical protein